jgi:hypothetical protein
MQKKINHLLCVPNEKNSGINKSFRDIARELKKFKKILMINPVTKDFLKSPPFTKTQLKMRRFRSSNTWQ